ncbi:MAG: type 2 isopentenyl-diphosphate Delta-isomerase [Proteobacteria bacterium SG_bin7]|nr:MAG: type 2 isopentenyl-diphosphate Delta-isomerase [Proteobacteria bacterium SG_bin7]
MDREESEKFELRKQDHIKLSLDPRTEAREFNDLDQIDLIHDALPEINFDQVNPTVKTLGTELSVPMFVSSMTAGHSGSININEVLATVCSRRNWLMGVGSQRRELHDISAQSEWKRIRKIAPKVKLVGNIGISQLVISNMTDIQRLVDGLEATAVFVHTNPLQECFQPEGTPRFADGIRALEKLCREVRVPVILKEVGCGFSVSTLKKIKNIGLTAVDVAGRGGTHWGRIEGYRSQSNSLLYQAAQTFKDWGISTVESLRNGKAVNPDYELWASGGVRSGLDAAKLVAIGANLVGMARPILESAVEGEISLDKKMQRFEYEFKVAMMCTGAKTLADLQTGERWKLKKINSTFEDFI